MNTETKYKLECEPENAHKMWGWIHSRGGVALWRSVNLSNPSASWSTPAQEQNTGLPYGKPNWQCGNTPEIITNPDEIGVYTDALFKAFPVGLKSSGWLSFSITDGAQRKVDKYMAQCDEKHGSAFYRKGVLDIDGASIGIYYTTGAMSLTEWIAANPE